MNPHNAPKPAPPKPTTPADSGACEIKGKISSSGEKIYHLPGMEYYDVTKITLSKGERCAGSAPRPQRLTRVGASSSAEPMTHYATRTAEPRLQTAGAWAIGAAEDRDLRREVAAEMGRLAVTGQALPAPVASVLT